MPFLPGGLDDIIIPGESTIDSKQLRKVAPGLSRGLRLPGDEDDDILDLDLAESGSEEKEPGSPVSLSDDAPGGSALTRLPGRKCSAG